MKDTDILKLNYLKREVKIIDIAKDLGYKVDKVGSKYTLSEHDSIRIDDDKNLYHQYSTGKGGSVIDFTMNMGNMNFKDTVKYLHEYNGGFENSILNSLKVYEEKYENNSLNKENFKKGLELPEKDNNMKNVFAYLTKTRGLPQKIVSEFVDRDLLYQDKNKNCVFVSRDIYSKDYEPKFACKRGTNTYKKFIADCKGNDYNHSFFIKNAGKNLVVTESVIDSMSVMSMLDEGKKEKHFNYDYLSLSGVAKFNKALDYHLLEKGEVYNNIFLCLDNDEAGKVGAENIRKYISEMPLENKPKVYRVVPSFGKDFNDLYKGFKGIDVTKEEQKICIDDITNKNIGFDKRSPSSESVSLDRKKENEIEVD